MSLYEVSNNISFVCFFAESLKSERLKKWQELEDKIQKLDPTFAKQPTSVGSPKDIHDNKSKCHTISKEQM